MSPTAARCQSGALNSFFGASLFLVVLFLSVARVSAAGINLAWDAVPSASVAGYMLHYGPSSGTYTSVVDVGNVTTGAVTGLAEGSTLYFAVTAYDSTHVESPYSNEVVATVPYRAPVASFSASTTSGTAPLALNFTNTSAGSITAYAWNFGDSTTSASANPAKVYSTAGVYSVALTVTGPGGTSTMTKPSYITVTAPATAPVAAFTASPTSGTSPLTVNFSNASTGSITSYAWNFGDGTTSTAQNPVKVYSTAGTYTVSLTVTGPGGTKSLTKSGYISVSATAQPPVAAFTGSPTSGTSPLTVNFASTSTGSITSYAWSFGDGATSVAGKPVKIYYWPGVYTVSLTVTGPGGTNKLTKSSYIVVGAPSSAPVAAFTGSPTSGTSPLTVGFTSTSTGSIGSYAWNFGDGTTSSAQNPVKVYSTPGTYAVSLTVTGPGGSSTMAKASYISVSAPSAAPVAAFTGLPRSGTSPLTVTFTSASTGTITSYAWNFGDGTTSSAQNPVKVYSTPGVYSVGLTVAGPGGINTKTLTNYVTVAAPVSCDPCTLWTSSSTPTLAADPDTSPVELGVKFKSDKSGYITGIRFYKSNTNTGTHIGSLWTSSGALLARATFTSESASGWQTVYFSAPVPIAADTVYVASYHTNTGRYANDDGYFASTGKDSGPLHALRDGVSGSNGMYAYAGNPAFPANSYRATNYWVDVMLVTSPSTQ